MDPYWSRHFLLPNQSHSHAQAIHEALEHAREGLAGMIGCEPFETVFTSGGTEANNLAIHGIFANKPPGHVLVSDLEHDSVAKACDALGPDWVVEVFPSGLDGCIDPNEVQTRLREDSRLVCLQAASPILGTIQPVREIADLCHTRGVLVHCDATQVFSKVPHSLEALRADTISISGHKFYGPKGSGALYVRRGLELCPISFGEPREMGLRAGSENVPACIGLGAAAYLCGKCSSDVFDNLGELRDILANGLVKNIPGAAVLCQDSIRLPSTLAIRLPIQASALRTRCRQLVFNSAQSEAPPDEMTRSLRAIGLADSEISRTATFSVGWTTSRDQIASAVEMISDACEAGI